jgi:DNA-binding PucR family transcriptional regulator
VIDASILRALRVAGDQIRVDADTLAARIAELLHRETPELMADPVSVAQTRQASLATIHSFLDALRDGAAPHIAEPSAAALMPAATLARAGIGLRPLLRFCHIGHGEFLAAWDEALAGQALPPAAFIAATRVSQQLTFGWMDRYGQRLSEAYERELAEHARTAHARAAAAVRSLLREYPLDADATSRTLGYDLRRWHTAVILWHPDAEPDAPSRLREAARTLAATLGHGNPLCLPAAPAVLHVWIGHECAPASTALTTLGASTPLSPGIRAAVGEPGQGPAGFRVTHEDAAAAFRLALTGDDAITLFRDVELAVLLGADLARTRRYVGRQLGMLAGAGEDSARLRETLELFLQSGARGAAQRLDVHPNTVSNRVRACRELLAVDLDERHADVQVALAAARVLGPDVLVGA